MTWAIESRSGDPTGRIGAMRADGVGIVVPHEDRITNRCNTPSKFVAHPFRNSVGPLVGVDTIRVTGHLECQPARGQWAYVKQVRYGLSGFEDAGARVPLGDGIELRADFKRDSPTASFEFSVPRLLQGHNCVTSSIEQTLEALMEIYHRASSVVEWSTPFGELGVMKLDLVRDAFSPYPIATTALFDGLRKVSSPYRPTTQAFSKGNAGTSVIRGTRKRWTVTMYCKDIQLEAAAASTKDPVQKPWLQGLAQDAKGQLRIEARLLSPVLRKEGIRTVRDLSQSSVESLHRQYFDNARFGTEVGGAGRWVTICDQAGPELAKKLPTMVGIFNMLSHGLPVKVSEGTIRKYRGLLKDLGLSEVDFAGGASSMTVRLDYDKGELVITQ